MTDPTKENVDGPEPLKDRIHIAREYCREEINYYNGFSSTTTVDISSGTIA